MYYFIRLFTICSLFYMHGNYAAESKITILRPYFNSGFPNAEELRKNSRQELENIFLKAWREPGPAGIDIYSFDIHREPRGIPEIYDGPACGGGEFISDSDKCLSQISMLGACLDLNIKKEKNFRMHLLASGSSLYKPFTLTEDFVKQPWTHETFGLYPYIIQQIEKKDLLVYIIGDDTPIEHPLYKTKMDAQWHFEKILSLKKECGSVVVLISKNRYEEFSIDARWKLVIDYNKQAEQSDNTGDDRNDDEGTSDESTSDQSTSDESASDESARIASAFYRRPLFIFSLGLAAFACGVFYYKYFINGSASNS